MMGRPRLRGSGRIVPAMILLDIGMPVVDGYEVARQIRLQPAFRDVLLIALTGWGQPETGVARRRWASITIWSNRSRSQNWIAC